MKKLFNTFEPVIDDLSPNEVNEFKETLANDELSLQERSNQLFDLLRAPELCVPEFIETLSFSLFCRNSCEDGFCEVNLKSIETTLIQFKG
eukprot:snap_masked-scaffold_22-processed-gene-3.8-mRNA-1 protein AED:1.00 eAED:1.00 QI:0/0/0/0/1/1/2/0/90